MFFSFPQARFFQETSTEMDVKLSMLLYKTNRQHFEVISMVDKSTHHGKLLSIC